MNLLFAEIFRYSSVHVCHAVTMCLMTDCRYSRKTCRLSWAAVGAVGSLLTVFLCLLPKDGILTGTFLAFSFTGVTFLMLVAYCVVYVYLSKGPWQKTLFLFTTYFTVFFFALELSASLSRLYFADSDMAVTVLRTGFFVVYILLLVWKLRAAFYRATADVTEGWGTMAALAVFTCAVAFLAVICVRWLGIEPLHWLVLQTAMLALVAVEYVAILRMIGLLSHQRAVREAEAQRKLLESQLSAEREFVAQARAYRHDMRHHTALITDYLEREDYGGMRDYLAQFQLQLDADALEAYCENPVADALLRLTARRCREGGIPFTIQAAIPEALSLTGPELATVLGNVLENAWEACRGSARPHLSVAAQTKGGSLLVEVENAVDHPSHFEDDLPLTTKPGGGQGLKNVRRTLEKHGGMLRCFRHGDTYHTQMTIPL